MAHIPCEWITGLSLLRAEAANTVYPLLPVSLTAYFPSIGHSAHQAAFTLRYADALIYVENLLTFRRSMPYNPYIILNRERDIS